MKKSFYVFLIMGFMFSLISCSTPEEKAYKEVYELGVNAIKAKLKSPSSAKFQELKEVTNKSYTVGDQPVSVAVACPEKLTGNKDVDAAMIKGLEGLKVDYCNMDIGVEAQNSFGVLIKSIWQVKGRMLKYKDGSGNKWEIEFLDEL